MVELMGWLARTGRERRRRRPRSTRAARVEVDGVRFTLTNAFHSSSSTRTAPTPASRPGSSSAPTARRSTSPATRASSATWQLIARLYKPDVAVLPIGDHFTMGPEEAALALELLGNPRCVPCHWGTFRSHRARRARSSRAQVDDRARGHGRAVRERWFGRRRRCPRSRSRASSSSTTPRARRVESSAARRTSGRPVVIRAHAEEVRRRSRPEVASRSSRPALLELDLTELTYG